MVIADSGSTKTTWRIVLHANEFTDVKTEGINPYFQSEEEIERIVKEQLLPHVNEKWIAAIDRLYYYGAGCSNQEKVNSVHAGLLRGYPNWNVQVEHDLLASARALCGKTSGIACILGTGSNSCLYNGSDIIENCPSWGYFFGDFGSGAHIGKQLIQRYANGEFSVKLMNELEKSGIEREEIINQIYSKPLPNRFLAGFAKVAGQLIGHEEINELVIGCFEQFFMYQVEKYTQFSQYPVSFVGSVAFNFQNQLRAAALKRGIRMGKIIKEPIDGLLNYHLPD